MFFFLQNICVVVESADDIAAFANYVDTGAPAAGSAPAPAAAAPTPAAPKAAAPARM